MAIVFSKHATVSKVNLRDCYTQSLMMLGLLFFVPTEVHAGRSGKRGDWVYKDNGETFSDFYFCAKDGHSDWWQFQDFDDPPEANDVQLPEFRWPEKINQLDNNIDVHSVDAANLISARNAKWVCYGESDEQKLEPLGSLTFLESVPRGLAKLGFVMDPGAEETETIRLVETITEFQDPEDKSKVLSILDFAAHYVEPENRGAQGYWGLRFQYQMDEKRYSWFNTKCFQKDGKKWWFLAIVVVAVVGVGGVVLWQVKGCCGEEPSLMESSDDSSSSEESDSEESDSEESDSEESEESEKAEERGRNEDREGETA